MPSRQWQIRIRKEFDRIFEVTLTTRDGQAVVFVDQVSDLATVGNVFVGTLAVHLRIFVDLVRVEVTSGAQASSGPIEKISAGDVGVHVPLVVSGIVFAAIGIDEGLDENGGVGVRVVLRLTEDDPAGHGIRESCHAGHQRLAFEDDVGARPSGRSRILMDHDGPANDRKLAKKA